MNPKKNSYLYSLLLMTFRVVLNQCFLTSSKVHFAEAFLVNQSSFLQRRMMSSSPTMQTFSFHSFRCHKRSTFRWKCQRFSMTSSSSNNNSTEELSITGHPNALKTIWNVSELKKETNRLILRCHKKIDKASVKLNQALQVVEEIRTCPNPTLEQLESCPNVEIMKQDMEDLRLRLKQLNTLELSLSTMPKSQMEQLPPEILTMVLDLGVQDTPLERDTSPRPKKPKGPRTVAPRKPYFRYYTENKTEIRVGRRSEDNDELSTNPEHADGSDWWMHASGCPGSHVVIRCSDNVLDREVVQDAAALAARQSKCQGNVIQVNLCRWRDVKKPPGSKPGLVQLVGKVQTVNVNMKEAEKRLIRLDATEVKN